MFRIIEKSRSVLAVPAIYSRWDALANGRASKIKLVQEYIRPHSGDRILDIGCGPGDILPYLPDVTYIGFDASPAYIRAARKRFGSQATFICQHVSDKTLEGYAQFDIVIAVGVIHHLDNADSLTLFRLARAALKPGGRLITYDGCFVEGQSRLARWFISKDRGQYVRDKEGYMEIASQVFSNVTVNIRHDMMRIPYTRIILECQR